MDVLACQQTWHESINSVNHRQAAPPAYAVIEAVRPSVTKRARPSKKQINYGGFTIIYHAEFKSAKLSSLPQVKSFEFVRTHLNASCVSYVAVASVLATFEMMQHFNESTNQFVYSCNNEKNNLTRM